MNVADGASISNQGAGSYPLGALGGGKYALVVSATFGGGNVQLQVLANDGSTWVNVGSNVTAAGLSNYDLPPGQYQFVVTTATAVYASITRVPS